MIASTNTIPLSKVRALREEAEWSIATLAHYSGVGASTIMKLESFEHREDTTTIMATTLGVFVRLAGALDVEPEELWRGISRRGARSVLDTFEFDV